MQENEYVNRTVKLDSIYDHKILTHRSTATNPGGQTSTPVAMSLEW